jgi:signal transduction histidine kinase
VPDGASVRAMWPRPSRLDVAFACASAVITTLALLGVGQYVGSDELAGSRWWVAPLMLVPPAALLWRRTNPLVTVVGVWCPAAVHALLSGDAAIGLIMVWPCSVSLYALAAYGTRRQLAAGLAVAVASMVAHGLNDPENWTAESGWAALWWNLALFVAPLIGGVVAGSRRARILTTEKALVEAEARAAVTDERARIARELHDVVTHHVNLVVLQAMAASGMLDRDPEKVREPLRVIEASGREALTEMRRLLGVLRDEDAEQPLTPQPGVEDVDALVGSARTAGLSVGLAVTGTPRRLPAGLALTVYRIVQEALTNAARHAAGSTVGVSLRYQPQSVEVAVVDDGGERAVGVVPGAGRGLLGMRERVAVFAGTLETGPSAGGGFAVHARLPVPAEEP